MAANYSLDKRRNPAVATPVVVEAEDLEDQVELVSDVPAYVEDEEPPGVDLINLIDTEEQKVPVAPEITQPPVVKPGSMRVQDLQDEELIAKFRGLAKARNMPWEIVKRANVTMLNDLIDDNKK